MALNTFLGLDIDRVLLSSAFLKTWPTLDTFQRFGNYFSFKQRLNSIVKIGNNAELIYLSRITAISSRPLALLSLYKF